MLWGHKRIDDCPMCRTGFPKKCPKCTGRLHGEIVAKIPFIAGGFLIKYKECCETCEDEKIYSKFTKLDVI